MADMARSGSPYMPMPATVGDVRQAGARLSNWGRWGEQDERGTLTFITPERGLHALSLPRTGETFALCIDLGETGPWPAAMGGIRYNPRHIMTVLGDGQDRPGGFVYTDDVLDMPMQAATQWD